MDCKGKKPNKTKPKRKKSQKTNKHKQQQPTIKLKFSNNLLQPPGCLLTKYHVLWDREEQPILQLIHYIFPFHGQFYQISDFSDFSTNIIVNVHK